MVGQRGADAPSAVKFDVLPDDQRSTANREWTSVSVPPSRSGTRPLEFYRGLSSSALLRRAGKYIAIASVLVVFVGAVRLYVIDRRSSAPQNVTAINTANDVGIDGTAAPANTDTQNTRRSAITVPARVAAPNDGAEDLPETPSRSAVASAFQNVGPSVRACGLGTGRTATVQVVFERSGRATAVVVSPPYSGTPVGSCIARAVRTVRIPPFSRPVFRVTYPFSSQ